jgi:hypothetical protein
MIQKLKLSFIWVGLCYKLSNKILLILFILMLAFSIAYECYLTQIPAPYEWFIGVGKVSINLAYGFCTGYIFYLFTVHAPYVNKQARLNRFIGNKITEIVNEIFELFKSLGVAQFASFDEFKNNLHEALTKINPQENFKVNVHSILQFPNFYSYLFWWKKRLANLIKDLFSFEDLLEMKALKYLSYIEDKLSLLDKAIITPPPNSDVTFLEFYLEQLHSYSKMIESTHYNVYYHKLNYYYSRYFEKIQKEK